MASSPDYLFVYGTLRSDSDADSYHRFIAPHFTRLARATIAGRLYLITDYPGLVPATDAADKVYGELHCFTGGTDHLLMIDEYEGCASHSPQPHLYTRKRAPVLLEDESTMQAWTYFYNLPVSEEMLIRSGNFLDPL